jgi:hypothetical protein
MPEPRTRRLVPVEVRPVTAPDGRPGVLVQLPDGFVVVNPEDAVELAMRMVDAAAEARGGLEL